MRRMAILGLDFASVFNRSMTMVDDEESNPDVGSSKTRKFGLATSSSAMDNRFN